jgi:pimeloyl-ACP methyl ester carboxylesterase
MANLPLGFPTIQGTGTGGTEVNEYSWGGNTSLEGTLDDIRQKHREFIKASGKAPIVFIHGNTGAASHPDWGWEKVKLELLKKYEYSDEHLWAISYLGPGGDEYRELMNSATGNISEIRDFINEVRRYCDVPCIDLVGHSMGCHEILCYLAGLKAQATPIEWSEEKQYSGVGSVILIDGAMRGLSNLQFGEWPPSHDVFDCLKPDPTPYGEGDPQTPRNPHNVKYWCCMVPAGYVDNMDGNKGTTGCLEGAGECAKYNMGPGLPGHEKVKDSPSVIADWVQCLNAFPPIALTRIIIDPPTGNYSNSVNATINVSPTDKIVHYKGKNLRKEVKAGFLEETVAGTIEGDKSDGQTLTLSNPGLWEVTFETEGACVVKRSYAIDAPEVKILTANSTCFHSSLTVIAETSKGDLYYNVDGPDDTGWLAGNSVTINESAVVKVIAIDKDGISSLIVGKNFCKAVEFEESVTASALDHYLAGRIDVQEYLQYSKQFGWFTPFTLYKINGDWVLDPNQQQTDTVIPEVTCSHDTGTYRESIDIKLLISDHQDAAPKVYYTTDGSPPTTCSTYFVNEGSIRFKTSGTKTLKYFAEDRSGNPTPVVTKTYTLDISDEKPSITADKSSGNFSQVFTVTITANDDVDEHVSVHYTTDGSKPDENRSSFQDSKEFEISANGEHAIACYAKDSKGNEAYETFVYTIDDQKYPDTGISPSKGGNYIGSVTVTLEPDEPCEWTKYTTDGSDPSDTNGKTGEPPLSFTVTETTTLKYRSKDKQDHLEPVQTATFTISGDRQKAMFNNDGAKDGYVKAYTDGTGRFIGSYSNLAIGSGSDGKENVAILHFDTSGLPDNANITRAYLEVESGLVTGDPWNVGEGHELVIDINKGYLGTSQNTQTDDWNAPATASSVATIDKFTSGKKNSSAFNEAGLNAINKTGVTQIRLRFDPYVDKHSNYIFIKQGAEAKFYIEYVS